MTAYRGLKSKLQAEFQTDTELTSRLSRANTLDDILAALGASYRETLYDAARAASSKQHRNSTKVDVADRAATDRETAILEVMSFFERDRAATAEVEVRRTGPRQLRVVCRQQSSPADNATAF
ncbi:hypothetical protein CKO28_25800 [Rhodovibrio sodomensis]|uniref:Uncharacterized protein n=1 Tax=Rhodovibrio sodomensis TaxID=1088 RepID=A0ABS1DP07_9PROT|nr:hypothetical protein [Rhodovibrio sodomensis]